MWLVDCLFSPYCLKANVCQCLRQTAIHLQSSIHNFSSSSHLHATFPLICLWSCHHNNVLFSLTFLNMHTKLTSSISLKSHGERDRQRDQDGSWKTERKSERKGRYFEGMISIIWGFQRGKRCFLILFHFGSDLKYGQDTVFDQVCKFPSIFFFF